MGLRTNLFFLDEDPTLAAQYLCDTHAVITPLKAAILVNRAWDLTSSYLEGCLISPGQLKWMVESPANMAWVIHHGLASADEYSKRYPGRCHASRLVLLQFKIRRILPPPSEHTPFPQNFPPKFKNADPVQGYRSYYRTESHWVASWARGTKPTWW